MPRGLPGTVDSDDEELTQSKRVGKGGLHLGIPSSGGRGLSKTSGSGPSRSPYGSPRDDESDHGIADLVAERRAKEQEEARLAAEFEARKLQEEEGLGEKAAQLQKVLKVDEAKMGPIRLKLHHLLQWWGFDAIIGIVIMLNAFTIGLESQSKASRPTGCNDMCECPNTRCKTLPTWVLNADKIFLGIYIIEISLRFGVYGLPVLKSHWVKFDAFLVISSVLDQLMQAMAVENQVVDQLMLVRAFRLARLARALRLMVQFQTLWRLVQGLMHSVGTLLWTFLLIMILIYILAIVGMEFIALDESLPLDHPYNQTVLDNFRDFGDAIMTLLQVFSFDSIGGIYRPLIKQNMILFFYFMGTMLILSIALMNLVTAVMVNSSLDQASQDKEAMKAWEAVKKQKQMEQLKLMFLELDEDGSGELSKDEIDSAPAEAREQLIEIAGTEDLMELFDMLDYDGGGTVGTDEFCEGVLKASDTQKPIELSRLVKQCSDILKNSRDTVSILKDENGPLNGGMDQGTQDDLDKLGGKVGKMEKQLKSVHNDVQKIYQLINERASMMKSSGGGGGDRDRDRGHGDGKSRSPTNPKKK
eukprot:TRINITY_DN10870_c1_g1_i3.p1 TRINITY_DN10870_c1_g1~~TRINITY_DN10870_c1_g1_i3.p1  ORF type:complete len:586 (-),score=124.87 TRINITY_DN10870_c1_g1_i3:184-1941(-)